MIKNLIIYKFFKDFNNQRKTTKRMLLFSSRPLNNILKYGDHGWNLPTIWQTRLLQILDSSASLWEGSGSQFYWTTTGIHSRPDAFDKSRFLMTFLTILGVTEILWSFRLVPEGKTGNAGLSMNGMQSHLHVPTRASIYLGMLLSQVQNFIWRVEKFILHFSCCIDHQ